MKKLQDVLFLCQFFYQEYISSATLPFDTAQAFVEAGYSVGTLCGYPKEYTLKRVVPKKETHEGIGINRIKYLQLNRSNFLGRALNYLSFLSAVFFHLPEIKKYKAVIVYSNPPILPLIAVLAKKLYGCKIIFISYDVYPEIGINTGKIKIDSIIDKGFRFTNKIIFRYVDKVVALSEDMKLFLAKTRNIPAEKIQVISNWAEEKHIKREKNLENPLFKEIPNGAFVISYLGNLGVCQDEKALFDAIRILNKNTNIHFIIAGHGTKMHDLKSAIKNEKLMQVHLYDFLQDNDYDDALRCSDLCIATLVSGMKGLCAPSKVSGYFMASCPVVMVAELGIELVRDIINNECGYHVNPRDSMALAKCILEQYENPELNSSMRANSINLYKRKYEKKVCLDKYIQLLKKEIQCDV